MGKLAATDRRRLKSLSHSFTLDGIVCCRRQQEAQAALKLVQKLLAKLDLAINPRKTTIQHVEKGFDYLGERFLLKHRRAGDGAVVVRPRKPAPAPVAMPLQRRLKPVRMMPQDHGDEDVWNLST